MANERDLNWKGYTAIETWAAGSRKTWQFIKSRFLFILVLAAVIFLLVVAYSYFTSDAGQRKLQQIGEIVRTYNPIAIYKHQLDIAQQTGNIWTAESNLSQVQAGILFKDFSAVGSKEIPQGSPFVAAYKVALQGVTLESTKIKFSCIIQDPSGLLKGVLMENGTSLIVPSDEVEVSGKTFRENVRCIIPPEATQNMEGTYQLKGKLSFPSATKNVKLNVYFTTQERLANEGIDYADFFNEFKIDESLPIRAQYNGEPVEIGMGVSTDNEQPVLVGNGLLGITLTNRWDGKVTRINDLTVSLPESVMIDSELTKNPNLQCPLSSSGSSRGRNEYSMDEAFKAVEIKKGLSQTYECFLKIDESVLGADEPYTKKAYVVNAEYQFESDEKALPFTVKKVVA